MQLPAAVYYYASTGSNSAGVRLNRRLRLVCVGLSAFVAVAYAPSQQQSETLIVASGKLKKRYTSVVDAMLGAGPWPTRCALPEQPRAYAGPKRPF